MTRSSHDNLVPLDAAVRLRLQHGRLMARLGDSDVPVQPTRCFPWSHRARWISLRDDEGDEVALIADPGELEPSSTRALEHTLAQAGFVFEVTAILEVREEVEIRTWRVRTRQGERAFQTPRDAWPRELPGGDYLVRDVAGDLYRIADPEQLDPQSRRHLWAFVE